MFTPSIVFHSTSLPNLVGGPFVRAYKSFVVLFIGCGFAFFFSVVLYPNLARRQLRFELSKLIEAMGGAYHFIIQLISTDSDLPAVVPVPKAVTPLQSETAGIACRLRRAESHLQLLIVRIQPLIKFAATEPRLAGRFRADIYEKILKSVQTMLDRLVTARLCIGPGLSKEIMQTIMVPMFEPRHLLHSTVRLLIYIYSSALLSKMVSKPQKGCT